MGIASFVLGIIAFFTFTIRELASILIILSIIFGIVSIKANKHKGLAIAGIVLSILSVLLIYSSNINTTTSNNIIETNKAQIIYKDNDLLVEIRDYKYTSNSDKIEFDVYLENNSSKDLIFTIDGNISVNDYMVEGGYFYKKVNSNTKANSKFTIKNLKINEITKDTLTNMKFKLDIYHSENFWIDERIEDDLEIIYNF